MSGNTNLPMKSTGNLPLHVIDDEPRVLDTDLAQSLGLDRPRKIRELISRHKEELERYGSLPHVRTNLNKPGRPSAEYYLNEAQSLIVSVRSDAPNAAAAREAVIRVFMAWRRGELVSPQHLEDQTRDLGISKATIKKITALENAVHQMQTQMEAQMRMMASRGYSPTFDFDDWLTAGDILDIEMIPRGERRALSGRITAALRSYAAVDPEKRRPPRRTPNKMDPQQRWRFHVSLVQAWLADAPEGGGGRSMTTGRSMAIAA